MSSVQRSPIMSRPFAIAQYSPYDRISAAYSPHLTNSSGMLDILKRPLECGTKRARQMGDPVNSFEIMGADLKKLSAFYQEAFAWKLGSPQPAYTMAYPREDLPVA